MKKFFNLLVLFIAGVLVVGSVALARLNNGGGGSGSGSATTPAGSSGQMQYNNGGAFGATTGVQYGSFGSLVFATSTAQSLIFQNPPGNNRLNVVGTSTAFTGNSNTSPWPFYNLHTPSTGTKYVEFEGYVASGTSAYFDIFAEVGTSYLALNDGTRDLFFDTSGDSYILSTGQFGIGITSPTADLQVFATASTTVQIGDSTHTGCIILGDSDGSGLTYVSAANGTLSATTTKPAYCR